MSKFQVQHKIAYKEFKENFPYLVHVTLNLGPSDSWQKWYRPIVERKSDRRVEYNVYCELESTQIEEVCDVRFYKKTQQECDEIVRILEAKPQKVKSVTVYSPYKKDMSGVEYVNKLPHNCRYRIAINLTTPEIMQALANWCKNTETVHVSEGFYRRAEKYGADPRAEQIYCQTWEDILTVQLMAGRSSGKLVKFEEK